MHKSKHQSQQLFARGIAIPDRTVAHLRYVDRFSHDGIGTDFMNWALRGNGAYDPDPVISTQATSGFNQYAQFYSKYRVISSKVTWQFTNNFKSADYDGDTPVEVVLWPSNEYVSPFNANIIQSDEQRYRKLRIVNNNTGRTTATIVNNISTAKMLGGKGASTRDSVTSLVFNIPAELWFWNFMVRQPDSKSLNGTFNSMITVDYTVEFFERVELLDPESTLSRIPKKMYPDLTTQENRQLFIAQRTEHYKQLAIHAGVVLSQKEPQPSFSVGFKTPATQGSKISTLH